MLQDIGAGKLDNHYQNRTPDPEDLVFCFRDGQLLLHRNPDDTLAIPRWKWVQSQPDWEKWWQLPAQYIFRLQDTDCYLWMGRAGQSQDPYYTYEQVRALRQMPSKEVCFGAMTAWHLYNWYQNNRFCGRCAVPTVHDGNERMLRCPSCGNMIFPRISPAVIIALTDGDRLLLSKYAGRSYTRYALLAGFTEIGETLEQTVEREVLEEVGLRVKNIRYYKSQPWGVDGNLLMGFYCDLDGDDRICLDETELAIAQWFPRNQLPAKDDGISLTREMIRIFEQGAEPR